MFTALSEKIRRDKDFPERTWRLDLLRRVLHGTLYDVLRHSFLDEYSDAGEYIPIAKRRPSVRYALCRIVVEDSVALLFGEGRFPTLACEDETVRQALADVIKDSRLNEVMVDAAIRGSVGSIAILMRVLRGRVFFTVMETPFLTPEWDREAPDTLKSVTERYKVKGEELAAADYPIAKDDLGIDFWFQRQWTDAEEIWFVPQRTDLPEKQSAPARDEERTVVHKLGFVPIAWVRNLPGGDSIDGACTFRHAIETSIEIDYQLSQAGRGLRYSSDPTLLIKEPAGSENKITRTASNAIVVDADGDAKLLEIGGTASAAVIEYVRALREMALESVHGNRSSADKISAAQSGRAMELMHQALIWLTDNLRVSYGEGALLSLMHMVVLARRAFALTALGKPIPDLPADARLSLRWPPWFHPTARDLVEQAGALSTLTAAALVSRETAVSIAGAPYGVEDTGAELARIAQDEDRATAVALARKAQTKATETLPP